MPFAQHPFWNAGFRPFFILAALAGVVLPLLWVGVLQGLWPAPPANQLFPGSSAVQWHAHEMFFGFGAAALIGFLLTASKNWVGIRGYHGGWLILLSLAWVLERFGIYWGKEWPTSVFLFSNFAFITLANGMLLHTLIAHRAKDSYRSDNTFFLIALPMLLPAKWLLLSPETFASGVLLTQGIFRLAFLIMLERTISTFMKNALQLVIARQQQVDRSIKGLALLLCLTPWLPYTEVIGMLELITALLILWRLSHMHIWAALQRIDIGIMHVGYVAIALQLLISVLVRSSDWQAIGSLSLHVFTLGAMGCIVPAMFIRIGNGHTGRRVIFGRYEKGILWLMLIALMARTLAPQFWPQQYFAWLQLTAACWATAFALWLGRFAPYHWQARADGKPG